MIHRGKQVIFARKISQNSLLGNTDRIGHILHRSTVVATLGNQSHGGIENFLPAFPRRLAKHAYAAMNSQLSYPPVYPHSPHSHAQPHPISWPDMQNGAKTKHSVMPSTPISRNSFSVYASSLTPGTRRGASDRRECRTRGPPIPRIPSRNRAAGRMAKPRDRGPECWPWPRTPLPR